MQKIPIYHILFPIKNNYTAKHFFVAERPKKEF
jgi:hypothetical protein